MDLILGLHDIFYTILAYRIIVKKKKIICSYTKKSLHYNKTRQRLSCMQCNDANIAIEATNET